jgi:TRAP-type transport system periplasmic protein
MRQPTKLSVRQLAVSAAVASAALLGASLPGVVQAQAKVQIIYSDVVSENDPRTSVLRESFGKCLGAEFDFKDYHGGTLFKQGTEHTAMQRGNLDMGNLAVFDFITQVPQVSILGTPYLFRDAAHMRKTYNAGVFNDLFQQLEAKSNIKVLSNPYIGTRHVSLKGNKRIDKPADLAGVKLRMPPGEGWQFIGTALGANPVPVAFPELYTAMQTGTVDAQDNPLPALLQNKFYEVSNQVILTGHLIATNFMAISTSKWKTLSPAQQQKMQSCANGFESALDAMILRDEATQANDLKAKGMTIHTPDREAFRNHVLDQFKKSKFSKDWPAGLIEKVSAQ